MKLHQGLMLSVAVTLLAASPALSQSPRDPDAPVSAEGRALGDCLITNSTPEHERMWKTMLIDALNEDTQSLNKSLMILSSAVLTTATTSCGLKVSDLQKPQFGEGMGLYGRFLGEKIMTAAMAKLGM
jgi:hypothetical protein